MESDVECKILFADISSIHSHLDVESFSNAVVQGTWIFTFR